MSALFRNLGYPFYHWCKRDNVNDAIRQAQKHEWLSLSDLELLQRDKLQRLLAFSATHVPYYRNLFGAIGLAAEELAEPRNFARIPLFTKAIIRDRQQDLISDELSGNGLIPNRTSGSTGEATYFYTDYRSTPHRKAAEIGGKMWAGWRIGERSVALWGSPIDQKQRATLRGNLHGWITRHKMFSSYDLSAEKLDQYAREIIEFKPVLLVSYPGPLEQFAIHCLERSLAFPSLRGIITSAETLWPHQRDVIEAAFGLPVFDRYGCREFGNIAQECSRHDGLHVYVDRVYLEVLDQDGKPCAPGQAGRIVVTDLDNFGWPMIRYEIGDNATWAPAMGCACGRGLPKLQKIDGRTLEVIHTPSGNRIGGTFWTILMKSKPGIKQLQVIQERIAGIEIRFVRDSSFTPTCLDYFRDNIRERVGADFSIDFVEVDAIELTESGKRRIVISKLPRVSSPSRRHEQ